ncbi:MAG: hypothetical protein ABW026_16585 [Microvirga sp.]
MKNSIVVAGAVALCWMWAEVLEDLIDRSGVKSGVWQVVLVLLLTAILARMALGPNGGPPAWQRWLWHRVQRRAASHDRQLD